MRTVDDAPRATVEQVLAVLHRACAMRITPRRDTARRDSDLYVVRFSCGLIKIGMSSCVQNRLCALPSEAIARGFISETAAAAEVLTPVVVVPRAGMLLEKRLHSALAPERVNGEWFRGPLSDAVVRALVDATEELERAA